MDLGAAEAVAGADVVYTDSWQSYGIKQTEERIATLSGIPQHDDEDELNVVYRPESEGRADEAPCLINLHLDARLGRPYSAVTVLVYLSDVSAGGGTSVTCPQLENA